MTTRGCLQWDFSPVAVPQDGPAALRHTGSSRSSPAPGKRSSSWVRHGVGCLSKDVCSEILHREAAPWQVGS